MSKIALIGDVHFDAKVSSMNFLRHQEGFFKNQFIPHLKNNGIKDIIQLGDIFDRRTNINLRILHHAKKIFFDILEHEGIKLHVLVGNHDIFYLETLEINSPEILLGQYNNIHIYTKPTTIFMDSVSFDIIPWICKENVNEVSKFIDRSQSDYCLGHFEIAGFPMYRGYVADGGLNPKMFEKYKQVWSGHYHTRSSNGNITYIGTPTEITWQDCDDPRGFEIFTTETLESEFIQNNYTLFTKVLYNEDIIDASTFDYKFISQKYVKIIIEKRTNVAKYDNFIQKVYESGCYDVSVEENFEEYSKGVVDETVEVEDTLSVVNSYIDSIDVDANKDKLKTLMQNLFIQAINQEI